MDIPKLRPTYTLAQQELTAEEYLQLTYDQWQPFLIGVPENGIHWYVCFHRDNTCQYPVYARKVGSFTCLGIHTRKELKDLISEDDIQVSILAKVALEDNHKA